MRFALALRWRLLLLWLVMLATSGTLAYLIRDVYQLGSEAQIQKSAEQTRRACTELETGYARATQFSDGAVDIAVMSRILSLVLVTLPGIEGGFWEDENGFVAYAFPTHAGSEEKKDVPPTERKRIATLAHDSIAGRSPLSDLIPGIRETVLLSACPLNLAGGGGGGLAAWAMSRSPAAYSQAYDELNRGLGLLLGFVVISGIWLGFSLHDWSQRFNRVEQALGEYPGSMPREIPATGDAELDRIVGAFNRFYARLGAERARTADLGAKLAHLERFAALGRMTAVVAHEVRNPIAAMRLKAENALALPDSQQGALKFILAEIERLDSTVKEMLRKAEPVRVHAAEVRVADWLAGRLEAFAERSAAAGVELRAQADLEMWRFDAQSLGRALDNLVANALQHTPRGGMVTVAVSENARDAAMRLKVCDTGVGVDASMEPRLFEPFVSGRTDGVGLGLALVREIAIAHGGEARYIWQPEGACFELEIPWQTS
ncbi:MAG TPA: HAMP domain-containing sensor histidine kinase [Nitrosospira sp.]|nr:HAMP domain-containing sensor histidine kinase [Nitrosospira sp.]